jgi:hypothetical protein
VKRALKKGLAIQPFWPAVMGGVWFIGGEGASDR